MRLQFFMAVHMKMIEAVRNCETSVYISKGTQHYIPESSNTDSIELDVLFTNMLVSYV
jgi:hypothetical protein